MGLASEPSDKQYFSVTGALKEIVLMPFIPQKINPFKTECSLYAHTGLVF